MLERIPTGTCIDDQTDRYEVVTSSEGGGFGKPYILFNEDEKFSLLKVFDGTKQSAKENARREADSIKKCKSRLIPKLIEFKIDDKNPWIMMDYIPGVPLHKYLNSIDEDSEMDWGLFFYITTTLATQISDLHKQGIIHRDLKPQNIIIDGFMVPHIIDLGEIGDDGTDPTGAHGTPQFESRSSFYGEKTKPVDVYAFGVTLYNIITRRLPFDDYNPFVTNPIKTPEKGQNLLAAIEKRKNDEIDDDDLLEEFRDYIKSRMLEGCPDDTYKESSKEFQNLSPGKQEIMKLVNLIIKSDGNYTIEDVREMLEELSKRDVFGENAQAYCEMLEWQKKNSVLNDIEFGNITYLDKAKESGFDYVDESIRECLRYLYKGSYEYDKRRECAAKNKFTFLMKTTTQRLPLHK